jgi:hypothetical protein
MCYLGHPEASLPIKRAYMQIAISFWFFGFSQDVCNCPNSRNQSHRIASIIYHPSSNLERDSRSLNQYQVRSTRVLTSTPLQPTAVVNASLMSSVVVWKSVKEGKKKKEKRKKKG